MPLEQGSSHAVIGQNIAQLIGEGKDPAQAAAIAYGTAGEEGSKRVADRNGWYEVKDNPLSKVGVFPYLGASIPGAPDPSKIYQVYRPEAELADPECLASFRLLPWVDDHTMLGSPEAGLTPAEIKGVHGVIGEEVYYKDGVLYGNIKVWSEQLADLIDSGKKELSCGYRCAYIYTAGVWNGVPYDVIQTKIRGNHLALVDEGRMGPEVSVLDHLVFTLDSKELSMEQEEGAGGGEMTLSQVIEMMKQIAPQVAELTAFMGKLKPLEEAEHGTELDEAEAASEDEDEEEGGKKPDAAAVVAKDEDAPAMDAAIKKLNAEVASLRKGNMKALVSEISRRDALARDLGPVVGTFDHADMTLDEVASYGAKKLGLTVGKGHEIAALNGYLAARKVAPVGHVAMDAKPKSSELDAYLSGSK